MKNKQPFYYYKINNRVFYTKNKVNEYIKTLEERPKVLKVEIYYSKNVREKYIRSILVKGLKPCHYTIS